MVTKIIASMLLLASIPNSVSEYEFPELPYATNALEPYMGQTTVETHWGKHLRAYVNNLNKLVKGTEFEGKSLEEICERADGALFNNGAQVWNHILFFDILSPDADKEPSGKLKRAIERDFGSLEEFKKIFEAKGASHFGSGWLWLSKDNDGKLFIDVTPNAENPLAKGLTPIIGFDLWEHSYYLDYKNLRGDYLKNLWHILDWDAVEERYKK